MWRQVVKYVLQGLGLIGLAFAIWMAMVTSRAVPVAPPVVTPARPPYTSYIAAAGIIETRTLDIQIGTRVAELVTEIYVVVGSRVKNGDPLFKLDDRSLTAQLGVQRATLQTALARVQEAEASLADLHNRLGLAEAVKDPRAISREDLTTRRYAVQTATAHLTSARADAKLAESQVKQTETNIDLLTVRAPVDGEVLQINTRIGEFAQAGPLATPLMLFGNIDRLHVRVDIDENDAWRFQPAARAMAFMRGNPSLNTALTYAWTEPFVIPKKALTGGTTERVDTRVMQVVYSLDRGELPIHVGQQTMTSVPTWEAMFDGETNAAIRLDPLKEPAGDWWRLFENPELDQLIDEALQHNHDVRRAAFRVMEARAIMVSSRAGLFPQLSVVGSESNVAVSKSTLAGLGLATSPGTTSQSFATPGKQFTLYNTAMDLTWELDLWGRIRRGLEAATADAEALDHDQRGVILTMLADLGAVYFELRELDELIGLTERTLRTRRDSLAIITSRYKAGLATGLDVKRMEELVESVAAQIPEYRRLRAAAGHHIAALVGGEPGSVVLPPKPLRAVVSQPVIPVGLPSQILERRPDILQAERNLVSANARIGEARAYFFPTFAITGAGGLQSVHLSNWLTSNSRTYNIGPSVTLPIFLGGTNVARLENAEARYQELLEQYQQTILNAFREVADVLVAVRTRAEQRDHQQKQVEAAREAQRLAQHRYLGGVADYLDVLDAEREILNAETALVPTEYARLNDLVMLFKALGGGWKSGDSDQGSP